MASKHIIVNNKEFNISYEILNINNNNVVVFLHGWGSNKEIMKQAFHNQFTSYKHIYIDMPGFGKSFNKYVLNTNDYAIIIEKFLKSIDIKSNIIIGHSFGGKVATLLKPSLLVLLSTAGIIESKSSKTLLTIAMAKIFNRFGLGKVTKLLRSNDVNMMEENMYETFKNVVDEDFSNEFKNYKGNTKIFWGKQDSATSIDSGEKINSYIKNSSFNVYDDDHYFFLRNASDISKKIIG